MVFIREVWLPSIPHQSRAVVLYPLLDKRRNSALSSWSPPRGLDGFYHHHQKKNDEDWQGKRGCLGHRAAETSSIVGQFALIQTASQLQQQLLQGECRVALGDAAFLTSMVMTLMMFVQNGQEGTGARFSCSTSWGWQLSSSDDGMNAGNIGRRFEWVTGTDHVILCGNKIFYLAIKSPSPISGADETAEAEAGWILWEPTFRFLLNIGAMAANSFILHAHASASRRRARNKDWGLVVQHQYHTPWLLLSRTSVTAAAKLTGWSRCYDCHQTRGSESWMIWFYGTVQSHRNFDILVIGEIPCGGYRRMDCRPRNRNYWWRLISSLFVLLPFLPVHMPAEKKFIV